jgi:hypothetical protein
VCSIRPAGSLPAGFFNSKVKGKNDYLLEKSDFDLQPGYGRHTVSMFET